MGGRASTWVLIGLSLAPGIAQAAPPEPGAAERAPTTTEPEGPALDDDHDGKSGGDRRKITVPDLRPQPEHVDRAASVVTRRQMQERLPRSAPDALRYEPGVYVQQTAHAQASPYVRGLTGQQTVLMFDGVRLNTSTFRQGPNQYFFTVDSRTLKRLEVVRGAASTEYGSDAMGGALLSTPIEPTFGDRWEVHPRALWSSRTADGELGGRGQVDVSWNDKIGFVGGAGYRDIGLLETAGPIVSPATGEPHKEPRFAEDGKTQLGTGFREFTADGRLVFKLTPHWRLTAGYYDYRQKDAPRTDACPPAEAPETTCLTYLDQFRTLAYVATELEDGPAAAEHARWTISYQNQHERRENFRANGIPSRPGGVEDNGRDDVHTIGTGVRLSTKRWRFAPWYEFGVDYGGDAYYDVLDSLGWQVFTDVHPNVTTLYSRGQYIDDSRYLTSGLWVQPSMQFWNRLTVRGGGRLAVVNAHADADPASESAPVDNTWVTGVGNAGVAVLTWPWMTVHVNFDQGFRAPNLDDLTSRQTTGTGFQLENANLDPEKALSLEGGIKVRHPWVEVSGFVYQSWIDGLIARKPFVVTECPPESGSCAAGRSRFVLVNLPDRAFIRGVDGAVRVFFPYGFGLGATIAWAWGEGPNPVPAPEWMGASSYRERLPLSRIPPLNGTAEIGWRQQQGFWVAGALRWARVQDRLAFSDEADFRIPRGGTPGFAVFELRAGYRWDPFMLLGLVLENVGNVAYRYHGSSVNGPGRSLSVQLELGF